MGKKDMLLALIEHYSNGNKAHFASLLGISPQGLSTWIKRESFDIELLFSKCEGLSAEWLLRGQGPMLKSDDLIGEVCPTVSPSDPTAPQEAHPAQTPQEGIPLIPFSAMAGFLTGQQTAFEYECERYVVPAFKGADFLMQVKGSSMQPTYLSGDIVACQKIPMTSIFFQWNKPYIVDSTQGPLIKRIKPGSDKNHIKLVSDSPEYDPFELPLDDITAVALVIGLIRLE